MACAKKLVFLNLNSFWFNTLIYIGYILEREPPYSALKFQMFSTCIWLLLWL